MQPWQNPTARAIAEAITRRDLANVAFAAGINLDDADDALFWLLSKLEAGKSSFNPSVGDPVRWARATLRFCCLEKLKKSHIHLNANEDCGEAWVVSKWSLNEWLAQETRGLDCPRVREIQVAHGYSRPAALTAFKRGLAAIEARKNAGESLDALAVFLDPWHPIWARQRAKKGGSK